MEVTQEKPIIRIFWSYAHENRETRDTLERYLGALKYLGQITMWCGREILPGTPWEEEIQKRLKDSDLVLFLVSDHFLDHFLNLHSRCSVEMRFALELWKEDKIAIISILINSVDYQGTPIDNFQVLPTEGKAINCWTDHEKAYADVAIGIRKVVETLLAKKWNQQGAICCHLGKYELALSAYEEAIHLDPCNPYFHCGKGNVLLMLNQYQKAIAAYETAIELKPDLAPAFQGKGLALEGFALLAREHYEELAGQAFQKANDLGGLGNIPVPDSLLKNIQAQLGQLTPEWAARQCQLGRESRNLSELDQAVSECGKANTSHTEGMESREHQVASVADSLDAVPKKPIPESRGQEYTLPIKKLTGTRRSSSVPWRLAAASIIMIVLVVIFLGWLKQPIIQRAQAASLSVQQSLAIPRSGATWVHAVSWSPNGKYIAVLWDDSTMQVLDAKNPKKEIFSQNAGWGYGLSWSPDSQSLAFVGEENNTVQIWNIPMRQSQTYLGHTALVEAIAWSPDGSSIASASDDGTVQIWDAHTMKHLVSYQYSGPQVNAIAWSPDGKFLVSGDDNGSVWTWDARTGKHLASDTGHTGSITSVGWSSDGNSIASSSYDGTVRVWNVTTGASDLILSPSNGSPVFAAIWSPQSSNYLALTCYDGSVQVWSIMYGQKEEVATYGKGLPNGVFTISWSPQGDQLIIGGQGKILAFKLGG